MKKTIFALSLCAILLLLSACGKSQAVKDVEKAISEIGDVTIESAEAIQNAQKLYNFLTDNEKEQVENRLTLMSAQDAYDEALREHTKQELAQVYSELKGAYESVEWFGADLYTAWKEGIYNSDKFKGANLNGSVSYLQSKISLSYDDTLWGCTHAYVTGICSSEWKGKEEHEKAKDAIATGTLFYMSSRNIPTACVLSVIGAYEVNGTTEHIQEVLDMAAEKLNTVDVSDSFHDSFATLNKYYDNMNAFLNFLIKPSGNFTQAEQTINDYKNVARECQSSLDRVLAQ